MFHRFLFVIFAFCFLSCNKVEITRKSDNSGLDNILETNNIVRIPDSAHENLRKHFDLYTNLMPRNGMPIHILAENSVTNDKIDKVKKVMSFFLKNYDSTYGSNKADVANNLGANKATICIFNDDENIEKILNDLKNIDLNIQTLSQNQILVDGSEEYFVNAYKDETYSNLIQLVYKFGIMGALPEFHKEIRLAAENAISKGIWISPQHAEWEKEGEIEFNYLATLFEVYFGLWQNEMNNVAFNGEYLFSSREALRLGDSYGYQIINNQFFSPYLDYDVDVYSNFQGTFRMEYDTAARYSVRSQYSKNVILSGSNDVIVVPNKYDNYIQGNTGNNMVRYPEEMINYQITLGNPAVIKNKEMNADSDTLVSIEFIQFSDTIISN